jgi:hypothetical protein
MHSFKGRILPVAIGAAVVVTGVNVASYAATGHSFHLGGYNRESTPTSVTNDGDGPAFRFKTGDGEAPFTVSSAARVTRLNASRLGGLRAGQLSRSYRYVLPANTQLPDGFQATDLPPGHYTVTFNVATDNEAVGPQDACFVPDSRHEFAAIAGGIEFSGTEVFNGSGAVTVDNTGEAGLICGAGGDIVDPAGPEFRNTLVFTRVQTVRKGTIGQLSTKATKRAQKEWTGR